MMGNKENARCARKMPGSNLDSATLDFMYSVLKHTILTKINSNM